MKTKKIVIGAMAAAMLSLSVCSIAPAVAADETVQISASKTEAEAGGAFKVDVSLSDIPSTGLQCCNFAIKYDPKVLTITDIKAGTLAGSVSGDSSSSMLPNFGNYSQEGLISVAWSTSVDDSSKWLKGEGTFCTISGTVASGVADGTVADISIVPTDRETFDGSGVANDIIDMGYKSADGYVQYQVKTVDGGVVIGKPDTTSEKYLKGDADCSGSASVSDVVTTLQYAANKAKYPLDAEGLANADVDGNGVVDANDAFEIQVYDATKEWLH